MALVLGVGLGLLWGGGGYLLRQKTKLSVVQVSALLALAAGLILPRLFQDGYLFSLICTAVSYLVMSSRDRLGSLGVTLLGSGLCAFIVFFGQNILVGVGGRLGTSAAASVLVVVLLKSFWQFLREKFTC